MKSIGVNESTSIRKILPIWSLRRGFTLSLLLSIFGYLPVGDLQDRGKYVSTRSTLQLVNHKAILLVPSKSLRK